MMYGTGSGRDNTTATVGSSMSQGQLHDRLRRKMFSLDRRSANES
jgi:hypothetical protein